MNPLMELEKELIKETVKNLPEFQVGDTIRVHQKILEGTKERVQVFEGLVIAIGNKGVGKSFTVRRISYDIGVERVYPMYSPRIAKIEIIRKGKVRRAKLYYLREKKGKAGRIKERKLFLGKTKDNSTRKQEAPVVSEEPAVHDVEKVNLSKEENSRPQMEKTKIEGSKPE